MRYKILNKFLTRMFLALLAISLMTGPSFAREYWLCAQEFTKDIIPGGAVKNVPMWGFFLDDNSDFTDGCTIGTAAKNKPNVPGPNLVLGAANNAAQNTLTVHLRNELPADREPISLVVAGLNRAMTPTWIDPSTGTIAGTGSRPDDTARVRSFDTEVPPGTEATFEWTNVTPGDYLYHSGTHPQVQDQMGLYGMVSKNAPGGQCVGTSPCAYPGVPFDRTFKLLFSEVDPDLHDAVAAGAYDTTAYPHPSTLDYNPKYFLINGMTRRNNCITGGASPFGVNDRLLIRMQNAGLREVGPMFLGTHVDVVAEGGNAYQFARSQHSVLLPPGSSKDVIFAPDHAGTYPILDRRLNLTNHMTPDGGAQWCIQVASLAGQPVADLSNGEPYSGTSGVPGFPGTPITFDGSLSSDDSAIMAYIWDFGDGSAVTCDHLGSVVGTLPANTTCYAGGLVEHEYTSPGTFAVSLVVEDDSGPPPLSSVPDNTTATVTPADGTPTANAGGPYTGKTGFPMTFDGSASSDPEGVIVSYDWDFGDTTTAGCPGDADCVGADHVTHTYATAATYSISLTVTDNIGQTDTDNTATATVDDNIPPVAVIAAVPPSSSATVTLDGCTSSDVDSDPLSYHWDFADGTTADTTDPTCSIVHNFPALGTYTVTLVVNDGFVDSAPATTDVPIVTVNNPPVVTNPGLQTNNVNDEGISLQIVATDPDFDNLSYGATGLPASLSINATTGLITGNVTAAAGVYPVTVTVTDDGVPPASSSVGFNWSVVIPAPDTISDVKFVYKTGPKRLRGDFKSSDTSGSLTMTLEIDYDGGADSFVPLGVASSLNGAEKYRYEAQPFAGAASLQDGVSQIRITSSLGGTATVTVQVD